MAMQPIETQYKGYRFRSRLEARYAVMFDALDIKWDYELEGFHLPNGQRYLPDFFLHMSERYQRRDLYPQSGYWVEIKGCRPTSLELYKMQYLCANTKHHGYILSGSPGDTNPISISLHGERVKTEKEAAAYELICKGVKHIINDPMFGLRHSAIIDCCSPHAYSDGFEDVFFNALIAFRSARFEFGERGAAA